MTNQEILAHINNRFDRIEQLIAQQSTTAESDSDEVIGIVDASKLLRMSVPSIYKRTCSRNGEPPELPHYKSGRTLFFKRTELLAWMTRQPVADRAAIAEQAKTYMRSQARTRADRRYSSRAS